MSSSRDTYELAEKNEILAALVARGHSDKELEDAMGVSKGQIRTMRASPLFMMEVNRLQKELLVDGTMLNIKLMKTAEKAVDFVSDLLDKTSVDTAVLKLQAENAQMILSKAGFGDTNRLQVDSRTQNISAMLTPEEMAELRERSQH